MAVATILLETAHRSVDLSNSGIKLERRSLTPTFLEINERSMRSYYLFVLWIMKTSSRSLSVLRIHLRAQCSLDTFQLART